MYIYHLRPTYDNQGITIVGDFNSTTKELAISIAKCSKKDQFCKKTGRELATQRCLAGDYYMKISYPQTIKFNTRVFVNTAQFILYTLLYSKS